MSTHIEICGGGEVSPKNTGFKEQCIESKLNIPIISDGFQFPTVAAFKTVADWKTAIQAKNLVPLFPVYELADASTEDTKFESGSFSKVTAKGVEKITFECYLSVCAYAALKSYENSGKYAELFEYNEDGDYSGVFASDNTKVKGRKITWDRKRNKIILQFDTQGNFIQEWPSISEAERQVGGDIKSAIAGRQKTAAGFIWKTKN